MGSITSAPTPEAHSTGTSPNSDTDTVIILGRKRLAAPSITAARMSALVRVSLELPFSATIFCTASLR